MLSSVYFDKVPTLLNDFIHDREALIKKMEQRAIDAKDSIESNELLHDLHQDTEYEDDNQESGYDSNEDFPDVHGLFGPDKIDSTRAPRSWLTSTEDVAGNEKKIKSQIAKALSFRAHAWLKVSFIQL